MSFIDNMIQLASFLDVVICETFFAGPVLIRDIKGANILVDPNGQIKLADFGMAKHVRAFIRRLHVYTMQPFWNWII